MGNALQKIRSIADYQFGKNVGKLLFPKEVDLSYSKRTGKIRYIYLQKERLATLRPTDGLFSLSINGAKRIVENTPFAECFVTVKNSVSKFVADGGDVFAVHVVKVNEEIRPKDEVIIIDEKNEVLAVGKALLSSFEMKAFMSGVAVKVRHGLT